MSNELNNSILTVKEAEKETQESFPEEDVDLEEGKEEILEPSTLSLPLGIELTLKETYSISAAESSIFVVLAGSTGCGKTTLVTSIYQQFLKDIPERYYFAGSHTLQAFESRSHFLRIDSNQKDPEMLRTQRGSLDSFLHIRIWDYKVKQYTNLLLSDFSGEDYDNVSANIILAREDFNMVNIAKFLVILLDGENIANKKFRHKEIQKAVHILHTFHDANLLHSKIQIIIAISKYDLVHKQFTKNSDMKKFVETIPKRMREKIPTTLPSMKFLHIAAMPENKEDIAIGYGIEDLLNELLITSKYKNMAFPIVKHKSISEFNLFQERVLR